MTLLFFIIKVYIVLLLFRYVSTQQELTFNPIGKTISMLTNPLFKSIKAPKNKQDKLIPFFIIGGIVIGAVLYMVFNRANPLVSLFATILDFLTFFMMFYIVSVLLGSIVNKPMAGNYVVYFFRIGVPWVKFTRTFIPISSGKIIYPAIVVIFISYLIIAFIMQSVAVLLYSGDIANITLGLFLAVLKGGLISVINIIYYLSWVMVARALISWVSPDIRNPVVQLIYTITEPILAQFRRIIPAIGMLDLSALAAIISLNLLAVILQRVISLVL